MKEHLQAIITVLSLVNPAVCGAMFARIEAGRSRTEQLADATKAAVAMVLILMIAALIGTQLLHLFGVSLDAFMVAGGGVLAWMGFSMLSAAARTFEQRRALIWTRALHWAAFMLMTYVLSMKQLRDV